LGEQEGKRKLATSSSENRIFGKRFAVMMYLRVEAGVTERMPRRRY
jgi:hypothetical protein